MSTKRPTKRRPTHPGAILREDVLPALNITQTDVAKHLGVSRLTVSELLHEKRALSPDMALRLSKVLSTSPESWLKMQQTLNIWELSGKVTTKKSKRSRQPSVFYELSSLNGRTDTKPIAFELLTRRFELAS